MNSRLGRFCRTVSYLRPEQVLHRLWYRARLPLFRATMPSARPSPPRLVPPSLWPGDEENGRRILAGSIRLIGLDGPADDWRAVGKPMLWRFHLHYFDWLADLAVLGPAGAVRARQLVASWLDAFEQWDPVAWHPYPLSLRQYAWLQHWPLLSEGADAAFLGRLTRSLSVQALHLARVPERDVGGNHLIKNLKALIAAGVCLPGHEHLQPAALAMLEREVTRQVLADGCHYERSPAYHVQVLADLMDLAALLGPQAPAWLSGAVARMAPAASFFRLGDGGLALFNDGGVGETAILARLPAAAPPAALPDAGYWRLQAGGSLVVVDAGLCCPDDLPAHAHADTLSFEMSVGRQRLVVNCGTYAYQDPVWRNRLRGTACHSTVAVDGHDSAEVYGVFRLARRPRRVGGEAAGGVFAGHQDGWRHLGLEHRRRLLLAVGGDSLEGWDELAGRPARGLDRMVVRFHLHPDVAVTQERGGALLALPGGEAWRFDAEGGDLGVEDSVWAPRFYHMQSCRCLTVEVPLTRSGARLSWLFRRVAGIPAGDGV
jgi:uncharacterized heparinase superfamily protein